MPYMIPGVQTSATAVLHALAGSPRLGGVEDAPGRCAICATLAERTHDYDSWQGGNYTSQNAIKAWGSGRICEACVWAHSWTPPPGFVGTPEKLATKRAVRDKRAAAGEKLAAEKSENLRLFSHLWDERDGYRYANKSDKALIRSWLRERVAARDRAWFAAIADTGQKHVLPFTRVNPAGAARVTVRMDERDVTIGSWDLVDQLGELLTDGVTKDELSSGEWRLMSWQQSGALLEPFEARFGASRGSNWYVLALWLAQRDEDEYKRRDDGRRETRAVAKADRGSGDGGKKRVPRGRRLTTQPLGSDQGSDARERADVAGRERVGDGVVPAPVAGRTRQAALFGD